MAGCRGRGLERPSRKYISQEEGDDTYMGVGLGGNVDTGVCASHTS
jgi:hypothetical protein